MISFRKKLTELRVSRKLSIYKLAHLTGISRAYINYLELGERLPPLSEDILLKLATALQVEMEVLALIALKERMPRVFKFIEDKMIEELLKR